MSVVEHHCSVAALVMIIFGGAEVYLDERLKLKQEESEHASELGS